MRRTNASLCTLLFAVVGSWTLLGPSTAQAQPGPTSTNGTAVGAVGPAPTAMPGAPRKISAQSVAAYLRNQNHKVQETKGADGRVILLVKIQQKDWHYDIEVEFMPDQGAFYLMCPMGKAGAQSSAAQLAELLKTNHRFAPAYFAIRPDQRLCLEDLWSTQLDEFGFQNALNRFLGYIQTSYSIWDNNRWPAAGGAGGFAGTSVP